MLRDLDTINIIFISEIYLNLLRKSPRDVGCLLGEITGCFSDRDRPRTLSFSPSGDAFSTGDGSFSVGGILLGTANGKWHIFIIGAKL